MQLELLANELILDIFEYLPAAQLVRAFHRLNSHFDNLLITHFQTHPFNFRSASKEIFESICRNDLPLLVEQITSFGLSDDDENPEQIRLFRSQKWTFNRFVNLHTLSFDHLREGETIIEILRECPQLIRLQLTGCYFGFNQSALNQFINAVWELPKLTICHLNIDVRHGFMLNVPKSVSISIEQLTIIGVSIPIDRLAKYCDKTPNLRSIALDTHVLQDQLFPNNMTLPLITSMNLVFIAIEPQAIRSLLRSAPNLIRLKIETLYIDMDGYKWEILISRSLPNLKTFQLKMRLPLINEQHGTELLQSFSTPFWLEEHRWFIQCYYNPDDPSRMLCLYTLPYAFSHLNVFFPTIIHSTQATTDEHPNNSFDNVQHLGYRSSSIETMIPLNVRCSNLLSISIQLPIQTHLISLLQQITSLQHLEITRPKQMTNIDAQTQLQNILDQTPHLNSLKFQSWKDVLQTNSSLTPMIISTRHIRRINLLGYDHFFTNKECEQLVLSPLLSTCETLFIQVTNRTAIPLLTQALPYLRSMIVRSDDDSGSGFRSSIDGSFVHELKELLPSTYSIVRDSRYIHHVRIWI